MLKNRTSLFITILLIATIIVLFLDICFDDAFNWHDIIVEFHGLIFDLLIFGVVIVIYDEIKTKKDSITRYTEEINDYKGWKATEAQFRVTGLVNRLIKLKVREFDLSGCHLPKTRLFRFFDEHIRFTLQFTNLKKSYFIHADVRESDFLGANLEQVLFMSSNIGGCDFTRAFMVFTRITSCRLDKIKLDGAIVINENWLEVVSSGNNNYGGAELLKKYELKELTEEMKNDYTTFKDDMLSDYTYFAVVKKE